MKPFFGFDLTKGKGNGTVNGDRFCVARPTEAAITLTKKRMSL